MDWTTVLNTILDAIVPVVITGVTAFVGWVAAKVKTAYEEKVQNEMVNKLVEDTVKYVQQVYSDLDGPAKLEKAVEQLSVILASKNINITKEELRMLIESSVYTVKKTFENTENVEVVEEKTNNKKKLTENK